MAVVVTASGAQEDVNGAGGDIVLSPPTGFAATEVELRWLFAAGAGSAANLTPAIGTGFTSIANNGTLNDFGERAVYRVHTGTPGSVTHTIAATESVSLGGAWRAQGVDTADVLAGTAVTGETASGTSPRTLPTITTDEANAVIVYVLFHGPGTATPVMGAPTTLVETFLAAGVDVGAVYVETQAVAGASTARNVTWTGGGSAPIYYAIFALNPTGGQSATVNQITETDVAQAIARRKTKTLGQAAETDLAQEITRADVPVGVGQTTETDLAQAITRRKTRTVGQAAETDLAQPVAKFKRRTVGQATETDAAEDLLALLGRFPAAVAANGRWIEDQIGDPWPVFGDSNIVIHTVPLLTADETDTGKSVESYLDELVAHGFDAFWCKFVYASSGGIVYENVDGEEPFVGTVFQTALNAPYWDHFEAIFEMAAARGITIFVFPTWAGFDDTEGDRVAMEAASGAQMEDYGEAIGLRFAGYPNLIWMNTGDRPSPTATLVSRWKSVQDGIIAAGATQLWGMQGTRGVLHSTYISTNSMGAHVLDLNTIYQDAADPTGDAATAWAEDIGPTVAYEMQYRNDPTSPTLDRLRLQTWGTFMAGANGQVMGNKPRWHMDIVAAEAVPGTTYLETWSSAGNEDRDTDDFAVFAALVDSFSDRLDTLVPDTTDTFLTGGEGTGTTRSAARFDDTSTGGVLAVAFRAHGGSATLTFDLTELAPAAVEISKIDPVSGAVTSLGSFATSGAQAVGSLGNNSSGDNDWVLVFEAADAIVVVVNQTTETDLAQSVTRRKTRTLGQVTETDVAQPCTHRKTRTLGQVTETDLAQPCTRRKTRAAGQAVETDLAQPFTRRKTRTLGQATEVDTAQGIDNPGAPLGQAAEVDEAQPFTARKTRTVGQSTEADVAQSFTVSMATVLGQPSEIDIALPFTHRKARTIGQAVEVDVALELMSVDTIIGGNATATVRWRDSATATVTQRHAATSTVSQP